MKILKLGMIMEKYFSTLGNIKQSFYFGFSIPLWQLWKGQVWWCRLWLKKEQKRFPQVYKRCPWLLVPYPSIYSQPCLQPPRIGECYKTGTSHVILLHCGRPGMMLPWHCLKGYWWVRVSFSCQLCSLPKFVLSFLYGCLYGSSINYLIVCLLYNGNIQ